MAIKCMELYGNGTGRTDPTQCKTDPGIKEMSKEMIIQALWLTQCNLCCIQILCLALDVVKLEQPGFCWGLALESIQAWDYFSLINCDVLGPSSALLLIQNEQRN